MDADGVMVRESFSLGAWSTGEQGKEVLFRYWEFVRRYMEEGAKEAFDRTQILLPIADRKESLRNGFDRMFAEFSGAPFPILLMGGLIAAVVVPGRWFAMKTSRIPQWPKAIDDQCRIEPGDPYVKDVGTNPPDLR